MTRQPSKIWLLLDQNNGIRIVEPYTGDVLETHNYSVITNWIPTETGFGYQFGSLMKPERRFYQTLQAAEVAELFQMFIKLLVNKKTTLTKKQNRPF